MGSNDGYSAVRSHRRVGYLVLRAMRLGDVSTYYTDLNMDDTRKCECCGWVDNESPCPACKPYIAKVVAEERERCAKIVEESSLDRNTDVRYINELKAKIAKDIRSGI